MRQPDPRHPFDADRFLEGLTEEVHEHQVDPDSPLGRAMASARAAWADPAYVPNDPEKWKVTPVPVDPDHPTP